MALELLKSKTGRTLIESHRGIEADVPENSWPAIKMGHELGADLLGRLMQSYLWMSKPFLGLREV